MKKPKHIHDTFVKQLLSQRDVAQAFLQEYLPPEVVKELDFKTMEYQNTSYLSKNLEASFSDMVWRIGMVDSQMIRVSILLEHKSYADPLVAFQMLEYVALGYKKQLENKQGLELIIPILYYHGKKKFRFKSVKNHFEKLPSIFQPYVPTYETAVVNLHDLSQDQIQSLQNGLLQAAFLFQKSYFDPERLNNSIKNILESLSPYSDLNSISYIFVYMLSNENLKKDILKQALTNLPSTISNKVMSIYDELIQEGIEKGIEQGIEKGRAEGIEKGIEQGIEKGIEKTILNAFSNGFDLNSIRLISGETIEKIEQILKFHKRL
jgi:predicted transposase/invertase (TIGR01784 family)